MDMQHDADPKKTILEEIGDISKFTISHNQLLCAVYIRPEKTKGGIYIPDKAKEEDRYQSKVGLILSMGPEAFVDSSGKWFKDFKAKKHDWIVFKPSDGWSITVNNVLCRMLDDVNIKGTIPHPDMVW